MNNIPPAAVLILGALLVPCFKSRLKNIYLTFLPLVAFFLISQLETGEYWHYHIYGYNLTLLRVDEISRVFGYIFTLNAFAAFIYAFHLKENTEHVAALLYIGSSVGVVFSGDLVSLYLFWEVMAVSSTVLILARRTERALNAGLRYILVHFFGGLCLLAGLVFYISQTGSVSFDAMAEMNLATCLMLLGFLVNAAAPPLSAWLSDAYPESTITGGVILSAYTTKTAVYALVRGYPGWEILIVVGCVMAIYGIVYALLENDIRRILAYSIINQLGFKVVGVGIGTTMAINGAIAHSFCGIIYNSLVWMSAGAVLAMTGRSKCTELGGLHKTMPWTMFFGIIGVLSISAFPMTSGFISKTLIIEGALKEHMGWVWLLLEVASAGAFLLAGLRFPYLVFFSEDKGLRPREADKPMLTAMAFLSFLCILLGVYPEMLYGILPFEVTYQPYTVHHVIGHLQLLMFSALAFFVFIHPLKGTDTISMDTDWFYRRGGRFFYEVVDRGLNGLNDKAEQIFAVRLPELLGRASRELPWRFSLIFLVPVWLLRGMGEERLRAKREFLKRSLERGASPVGIGAAAATAFLLLFFILTGLL
ncbi:MAG: Na(+)/H(+) antiporter subunit D [Syntrophobacteraceae bacterium]|jgi:multicomponent Na+:H+ antiporter subunit D|nr:Na(+)/H(+) antiporter subunit D [Syntrophobacteraceae bacterium]